MKIGEKRSSSSVSLFGSAVTEMPPPYVARTWADRYGGPSKKDFGASEIYFHFEVGVLLCHLAEPRHLVFVKVSCEKRPEPEPKKRLLRSNRPKELESEQSHT